MPTVSGKVTPLGNTFAVADAETIKGGFMVFPTNTERDALHSSKMTLGMEIKVVSPEKKFKLTQITPSVVWTEISTSPGDMLKAVYDPDDDGIPNLPQLMLTAETVMEELGDEVATKLMPFKLAGTTYYLPVVVSLGGATTWWDNNGAIASAVAAYAPKGAADFAASKTNLAGGGHTLANGTAFPTWSSGTGWTFNGSTQYLLSDLTPPMDQSWSAIVKFSGAVANDDAFIFGLSQDSGLAYFAIAPRAETDSAVVYLYGTPGAVVTPGLAAGVLGIRGGQGNRNGDDEGAALTLADFDADEGIAIGALSGNSGIAGGTYWGGVITSIAFYDAVLTEAEMAAVASAMP